jgi:hypothetical protein
METQNQENSYDVISLRNEITENEEIIDNYLKTAQNMKWLGMGTLLLSVFFFFAGSILSGIGGLVLAFLCLRKYNQSMGMAEVYFGVTKFLKYMLEREITGDTSIPAFLQ